MSHDLTHMGGSDTETEGQQWSSEARSSVQLHGRVSKFNNNVGQKKGL